MRPLIFVLVTLLSSTALGNSKKLTPEQVAKLDYYWICQCFVNKNSSKVDFSFDLIDQTSLKDAQTYAHRVCLKKLKTPQLKASCIRMKKPN